MAATEIKVRMQQRRDTAAGWTSADPVLLTGELGYETDTGYFKLGDGSTAWSSLAYLDFSKISAYPLETADLADDAVTSAKIADGTIVNADVNASAAIADTKLDTISTAGKVSNSATTATDANTASAIVARDASGNFSAGTITADLSGNASTVTTNANLTGDVTSVGNATSIAAGAIVDADVNASAAIAGTKIDPDFGSQTIETTGVFSAAGGAAATPSITFTGDLNTGIYSPVADTVAITTAATERLRIDSSGSVGIGTASPGGNLTVTDASTYTLDIKARGSGIDGAFLTTLGSSASLIFGTNNTERLRISSGGELYSVPTYSATTTNAANVFIASNGNMARSTSSRKYKTNIETLEDQYADSILDCRPVWFRSIATKDNPDHGYWGFIAEEVAEIDPRLVHWKTIETSNDENGSIVETPCDPEPEGVQYDRFVPHLLNLIKRQKEQIEAMEARLTALEAS